jgi:glycosyltransferase involved in cell wall biosynthesis
MNQSTMGSRPPLVSAIIPLFNKKATLLRAIKSVERAGRDVPIEAIVVNDGSTDGSDGLAEALAARYPWITYVSQSNFGAASARNRACTLAKSQVFAFLDADDEWQANHARNLISGFNVDPSIALVINSWRQYTDGKRRLIRFFDVNPGVLHNHFLSMAWGDCYAATSATACRKKHFIQIGGFDEKLRNGQDRALWGEAALCGRIWYTGHAGAIWHQDSANSLMESAYSNRHPKYENWLEGKIEQLAGAQPMGTRHNGVVLRRQMIENLICDSEITGSQAASKGIDWLRDERVAVLEKWGRGDLAAEIMAVKPGGRVSKRLSHRN